MRTCMHTIKISVYHIHWEKQSASGAIVTGNSNLIGDTADQMDRSRSLWTCCRLVCRKRRRKPVDCRLKRRMLRLCLCCGCLWLYHLSLLLLLLLLLPLAPRLSVFDLTEVKCFVWSCHTKPSPLTFPYCLNLRHESWTLESHSWLVYFPPFFFFAANLRHWRIEYSNTPKAWEIWVRSAMLRAAPGSLCFA